MTLGLETDLKKRTRRTRLQSAILSSLELGGLLALTIVAPNVVQLFKGRYTKKSVMSASQRLAQKGLVRFREARGKKFLELTRLGGMYLDKNAAIRPLAKWDEKWRMVIFDIPQARTGHRNLLRHKLREIGFEKLQNSVFVYPYDCEELVALLKTEFGLGKEVLYIIADSIENDRSLRGHFGLKQKR